MRRKIDGILDRWADNPNARPLLIRGARRVGKTYAVKRLGNERFAQDFVYCDFQANLAQLESVFSGPTDVERIVADLSLLLHQDITAGRTLIAFDEIQLCEKALNSLRFFAQSPYRVIATGSQLGIAMRDRTLPFPSDVDQVYLRPLDFEEFLWALGQERLADGIRSSFASRRSFVLHDEALDCYRRYTVVGGMPKVVDAYRTQGSFADVRTLQAEIEHTYTADIALYAPSDSVAHVQAVWASIPKQLARESTRKFKYTDVGKGGRERMYRMPLAWLEAAELVSLNYQTNDTAAPLVARDDGSFFKVYLADTGLMFYRLNLAPEVYLDPILRPQLSASFRGALAENYVMQALTANEVETFYWTPGTTSQNEVEFVVQNRLGRIVPIEVKSGSNTASRSLNAYLDKTNAPLGIRLSSKNFGFEEGQRVLSVPLYAAFCLDEETLMSL